MKSVAIDISKRLDMYVRRGATFSKTLLVKNANGTDFDFTGYAATLDVYSSIADRSANLSFSSGSGLTLSAGQIILSKTVAQMNLRRNDYKYFLWITYPDTSKKLWVSGSFIVNEGEFDGLDSNDTTVTIDTYGSPVTISLTDVYNGPMPIEAFAQALQFNRDKELEFNEGGALSFTLSASGNLNGMGIIMKLNLPTSVVFSGSFIALPNSQSFDSTKMNIVTLVYFENYDGNNTKKVLYNNNQLTAV